MKQRSSIVPLLLGLAGSGCGEITAFCMSAGAPSGATLEVTTVPTPNGLQVVCGPGPAAAPAPVDSSRSAALASPPEGDP